jgi:hypothetical protein
MLSNKATFFFYLAALICFVVAAAGDGVRRPACPCST